MYITFSMLCAKMGGDVRREGVAGGCTGRALLAFLQGCRKVPKDNICRGLASVGFLRRVTCPI